MPSAITADLPLALTLVLIAAVLHAVWNAMVKHSGERVIVLGLIALGHVVTGLVLVAISDTPAAPSWPFIAASTAIHWFYYFFLVASYRLGDLSLVYPIARGIAPVLVATGGFLFAGETLPLAGNVAIAVISLGICLIAFGGRGGGFHLQTIGAALMTGVTIAAYSVVDGLGVRRAGDAIGYIGWLFVLEGLVAVAIFYGKRAVLPVVPRRIWVTGLVGGLLSAGAYGLVIFAKTLAPLGAVSAVRESSVAIAALIGVVLLGERPWKLRIASSIVVAGGIVLLATTAG